MMNMQAGIPKAQLMAGDAMNRALTRMAHEMMEQLMPLENVVLVGIRRRGVPLAQRLSDIIEKYEHVRIPVGEVDIAMYRDDRDPAQLNVEVQEKAPAGGRDGQGGCAGGRRAAHGAHGSRRHGCDS